MKRRDFVSAAAIFGTTAGLPMPSKAQTTILPQGFPTWLVDAFTDVAFSGNPAPVVHVPDWPSDAAMQAFASEMNKSEVAYIRGEGTEWEIRWFTPVKEVEMNGHATLAASAVIFEKMGVPGDEIHFFAKGGALTVARDGAAYLMNFPMHDAPVQVEVPKGAEADLGIRPAEYWVNARNIAVYNSAEEVAAVVSKITKDTAWTENRHVIVTGPGSDGVDYVLRYFVPILNIPEDPVSGVPHQTLAPFWAKRLGRTRFNVRQLSKRGGFARTEVTNNGRVLIGGPCVTYMEGRLTI